MGNLIELGFVCQAVLLDGEVVSVSVRDARSGQLIFVGPKMQDMVDAMFLCIDDFSRSMDAQLKAMDNA